MDTRKTMRMLYFILPLYFLLLFACNGNQPKPDEPADDNIVTKTGPAPAAVVMSGTLDTLYVASTEFNKMENGKRVLFCFAYRPSESLLTLDGWITKGNTGAPINLPPDIKLLKYRTGTLSVNQNLYLGNVFLDKDDIKKIKDAYEKPPKYLYVVFAPRIESEHVIYRIYVSNDSPGLLTGGPGASTLTDTGLDANPSPPKDN
jgi:hypothetical protein